MQKSKITYDEIARGRISKSKNLVISKCSKGGYTLAQQVEADDDGNKISIFLKGAFRIEDEAGLVNLRDALNVALNELDNEVFYDGTNKIAD